MPASSSKRPDAEQNKVHEERVHEHLSVQLLERPGSFCSPIMKENRGFEDWRGYL